MAKPHVTRTIGPIHFEDLDPHRFEDLVRQLAYDFRHWQSIESTGRGGADEGFDIRAYEVLTSSTIQDDEENPDETPHPMEGNLWMIQCKREKELGPKRIESIICDAVIPDNPPYGFILAAPAHFSKTAHDKFREGLRNRNVMEFYLWGAGELEDMLYQPKNDHILFAFFGVSLTSRRRSMTTQIRASVSVKNKLRRCLGDTPNNASVLVRDLQDAHYPYDENYKDFEKRPRWKEYSVLAFHPLGLVVSVARNYAYYDKPKAEWDFTKIVNNVMPGHGRVSRPRDSQKEELRTSVKGFWEHLPRNKRATFVYNGLIRFDAIAFVDDKGDSEYDFPHIFIDFHGENGPFSGGIQYLEINEHCHEQLKGLNRIKIFPAEFKLPIFGTIYKDRFITVDKKTHTILKRKYGEITLYDAENKYNYLHPSDVIGVEGTEDKDGKITLLKITNIAVIEGEKLLRDFRQDPPLKQEIEDQISRAVCPSDTIQIIEAIILHDWQIDQNRPVI